MKLPVVSGDEFVKRLAKVGYKFEGQEGSHMILRLTTRPFTKLSVPRHKELAKGLLRRLLRDASLTVEEFVRLKK
jgi:predicted RNA binding protein YcfA (HicA-like mRNA interferase family)